MQRAGAILAGLVGALGAAPALAAPAQYDIAFVSEFADSCVPQRLSYEGTKQTAESAGWRSADRAADTELKLILDLTDDAAAGIAKLGGEFAYATYSKPVDGATLYLVVSRAEVDEKGQRAKTVGCYLYDFDAAAAIDPEALTALLGAPPVQSQVDMHVSSYQWTPTAKLPGTLDTYLTFIPEVSQYKDQFGFSGLMLQFNSTEPDAKESQS